MMGTIARVHFNNITEDLNEIEIRDLIRMLEQYLQDLSDIEESSES